MSSPAVKLLQSMIDEEGRFWYSSAKTDTVRDFYATCSAKCAVSGDWYDAGSYFPSKKPSTMIVSGVS